MVYSVNPCIGQNKEDGLVYFQISDQVLHYTTANCKANYFNLGTKYLISCE